MALRLNQPLPIPPPRRRHCFAARRLRESDPPVPVDPNRRSLQHNLRGGAGIRSNQRDTDGDGDRAAVVDLYRN